MKYITNLFKGRINRTYFLIGYFSFFPIIFLINVIFSIRVKDENTANILGILVIIIFLFYLAFYIFIFIRRLHDLGRSAWSLFLFFIPLYNLYLLLCLFFKKGEQNDNKFGKKPEYNLNSKKFKNWLKKYWVIGLIILIILAFAGIYTYKHLYIPYKGLKNGFVVVSTFDCPKDHPIKAHRGSMIYHVPGDTYYRKTNAANGYCFDTTAHAREQGFRAPYN